MNIEENDRKILVTIRLERANGTFDDACQNIQLGLWRTAANRLYYACYYAVSALLIKNDLIAHTHKGVINQLGLHFVKNGLISIEKGRFFKELFYLRQDGDYDDWFDIREQDVKPLIEPAKKFIEEIENLINA